MSDRIRCIKCGAESYNQYGHTQLVCVKCWNELQGRIAALEAENTELKAMMDQWVPPEFQVWKEI